MPPDLTRQLDDAVAEVFAVMLNLACTCDQEAPAQPGSLPSIACLTASVEFSGTINGICTLQLDPAAAADLTSNLTGIPAAEISAELCADTAGELCNMIAGNWKTRQPAERAACHLSCPAITRGPGAQPSQLFRFTRTLLYRFAAHHLTLHLAFD